MSDNPNVYICDFCETPFTKKSSVVLHQKTAKYCQKIQASLSSVSVDENIKGKYSCEHCDKNFTQKKTLQGHLEICSNKKFREVHLKIEEDLQRKIEKLEIDIANKDKIIEEYKNQISELQDKLAGIATKAVEKPTYSYNSSSSSSITTNKTTINQKIDALQYITEDHLKDSTEHLTIEHLKKGPIGFAEYALEHPFKDSLLTSDYARRIVNYKDFDRYGNERVVKDPDMRKLSKKFFQSIRDKNEELALKYRDEISEKLKSTTDSMLVNYILNEGVKVESIKDDAIKASKGFKSSFSNEFIKEICANTLQE